MAELEAAASPFIGLGRSPARDSSNDCHPEPGCPPNPVDKLTPDQYEAILRPVFKDDEMLMITVGAVLGFLVGELQVVLVEHLAN